MSVSRYPLSWPPGWPRKHAPGWRGLSAPFKVDFDRALRDLDEEIRLLGGADPVLSTNLKVRLDGSLIRSTPDPEDRGAAVYFDLDGRQKVFACDTFASVRDNIRAIGLTIAALRRIKRYGASDMMDRAFILGVPRDADEATIRAAHRRLAVLCHPDKGGTPGRMAEINRARDLALAAKKP